MIGCKVFSQEGAQLLTSASSPAFRQRLRRHRLPFPQEFKQGILLVIYPLVQTRAWVVHSETSTYCQNVLILLRIEDELLLT
jgi:hypothetical protein